MGGTRSALLWVSENRKLRQSLPRYAFIRKAVSRFMPGETVEDEVRAAEQLREKSIGAILTQLGENIAVDTEAESVKNHYLNVLAQIDRSRLDAFISVKLTQL